MEKYTYTILLSTTYTCGVFSVYDKDFPGSRTYEYGKRIDGDEINYTFNGLIPSFEPNTYHVIDPAALRSDLAKNFTYLKVDYASPLSYIEFYFDIQTFTLSFYVKLPFIDVPFTITGYSVNQETFDDLENLKKNPDLQRLIMNQQNYVLDM